MEDFKGHAMQCEDCGRRAEADEGAGWVAVSLESDRGVEVHVLGSVVDASLADALTALSVHTHHETKPHHLREAKDSARDQLLGFPAVPSHGGYRTQRSEGPSIKVPSPEATGCADFVMSATL